jgi:hypothetical protein
VDVVGKCNVTAIDSASANDFQCDGGSKKVTFQFVADDSSAKLEHGGPDPARGTLTGGGGQLPSPDWLEANSVKVGAVFGCTRRAISQGTCSPVVWAFPDLKLDAAPCR